MKSFARITLIAALLFATATRAATGSIGVATTDAVTVSVDGMKYASARWIVTTAGTAKVTAEMSLDGVNWLPAPYSQTLVASANPPVAPWQNTTPVLGSYDTPLPSNAQGFRIRCGTIGTATVVQVTAGYPFVAGRTVVATVWDQTSGVNSTATSPVLDFSGWSTATVLYSSGGATTGTSQVSPVADDGTVISGGNTLIAANTTGYANLSRATAGGGAAPTPLLRRFAIVTPGVAAQATRTVVYASR